MRFNIFNRGSAIAKIVGANVIKFNNKFDEHVTMYVYEEMINNKKLSEIINEQHENVKYLPGHKIPENVVSAYNMYVYLPGLRKKHEKIRILLKYPVILTI